MRKRFFYLFFVLNGLTISAALAKETLYYIIRKSDWLAQIASGSFHPPSLLAQGFIPLLPREQVIATAQAQLKGQTDLLLLNIEVPFTDSLLKWKTIAGRRSSEPRYYGALPRTLIAKVYPFRPNRNGDFAFPKDPFLTRLVARAIPDATVEHFLSYQDWQKTKRLYKLQRKNFADPKVQLQWWYFDFFLADGSSVVLAFIPQNWWDKGGPSVEKKAMFTMALKTKDGAVKRFMTTIPQTAIRASADRLEIPSHLIIESLGSGTDRTYSIKVNFPGLSAVFTMMPTRPPFAAYPTGTMPGVLMTLMSGADWGSPRFSYVSQIPNSRVAGSLVWEDYNANISGQGYHEQGRLDDTPERQGGSWTWYHFSGEGWSVFGSPGSYIYLQQNEQVLRSGFHLVAGQYSLQNRTFSSPDHPKILTGGDILFHHQELTFRLSLSPVSSKTLVSYPSPINPNQIWGTVGGTATLFITDGLVTKTIEGRMFLETCSWEIRPGH